MPDTAGECPAAATWLGAWVSNFEPAALLKSDMNVKTREQTHSNQDPDHVGCFNKALFALERGGIHLLSHSFRRTLLASCAARLKCKRSARQSLNGCIMAQGGARRRLLRDLKKLSSSDDLVGINASPIDECVHGRRTPRNSLTSKYVISTGISWHGRL